MNGNEMNQVLEWIQDMENIENLQVMDKLVLMQELAKFCEAIKPIVVKSMAQGGTQSFLFKMGD